MANAFFLWVGSPLPPIAQLSVLSALARGFCVTLFTDREQKLKHPNLSVSDYRTVYDTYRPDEITLKGRGRPYYAGFANIFRYKLLSQNDGWWFDCDTIIFRSHEEFSALLEHGTIVLGSENDRTINNAVIGSLGAESTMERIFTEASERLPDLRFWGETGPTLVTKMIRRNKISAKILSQEAFYPIDIYSIDKLYLPSYLERCRTTCETSYCVSLWAEKLSQFGFSAVAPPKDSYLAELIGLAGYELGVFGDDVRMTEFLSSNMSDLQRFESGKVLLSILCRKVRTRCQAQPRRLFEEFITRCTKT